MSGLPERVTFGPMAYDVVAREMDESYARYHHVEQRISVDPRNRTDRSRVALFHEILHVVIHMAVNHDVGDAADEERIVTALSPWLVQVLRDNPALVAFLTAEDAA